MIASHKVNSVSELHTELMVQSLFADFARLFHDCFCNKTNGVTPWRWLALDNPPLSAVLVDIRDPHHHGSAALPSSSVNVTYHDRKVIWSAEMRALRRASPAKGLERKDSRRLSPF